MHIVTTLLRYDHGILRQALDVLDDMATDNNFESHRQIMPEAANFLLRFMDRYHHAKEERFIFPIASEGPEQVRSLVPDLFDDHHKARALALAIADDVASWDLEPLAQNIRDLAAHMRHHIQEEEDIFFPGVDEVLGGRDLDIYYRIDAFTKQEFGETYPKSEEDFANRLQDLVWGKGVRMFSSIKQVAGWGTRASERE
jgi:hemerythrin-like domain-containing protein